MTRSNNGLNNNRIATLLASVITLAWAISFMVDIFIKEYDPSPSVHALMMIVAGAVFGEGLINKGSDRSESPVNKSKEGE